MLVDLLLPEVCIGVGDPFDHRLERLAVVVEREAPDQEEAAPAGCMAGRREQALDDILAWWCGE